MSVPAGLAPALALLAAAVLALPGPPRGRARTNARTAQRSRGKRWHRGRDTARHGAQPAAVAALGVACVVVAGLPAGLFAALICCPAAAHGLRVLARRPVPTPPDPALPVTLDLAAAALRSGRPLDQALTLAAPAAREDVRTQLLGIAGLLSLGALPAQAWAAARDGPLQPVAPVATRSAASGIKIAGAFEDLAEQLRAERATRLAVRANRAGIGAMAPLAACYLPSFVCLGVVPAVVGIARSTVGVLP